MSGHHAEKSETSVVSLVAFLFFGLIILCGLEFADNAGKGELLPSGGGSHHH